MKKEGKQEKPKRKVGRPSLWKDEFVEQAYKLCLLGATDVDIASFFGIDEATLYRWKGSKPQFCEALKAGKEYSDSKVVRSLYQRATGYSCLEDRIFNNNGEALVVPTTKHYPPDVTACIFWLKNRQKDAWRDKVELAVEDKSNIAQAMKRARERVKKRGGQG